MDLIIDSVYTRILEEYRNSSDISILSGTSGKILFLSYLYHTNRDKHVKESIEEIIEYTITLITNKQFNDLDFTYGGGIAGFYWVINHIYQNNLLFEDSIKVKDILCQETDDLISESLNADFRTSKYDPLYGYVGKGHYFISKPETFATRKIANDILVALTKDKVRINEEKITWVDVRRKHEEYHSDNERIVLGDCGHAHGVTGIISFLCDLAQKFNSKQITDSAISLIKPAVEWLLSQEIPPESRSNFMFPLSINLLEKTTNSKKAGRLGWCYGDNIIAYVLYKASAILKDPIYRKKAEEITFNSCRIPFDLTGVMGNINKKKFDPTLCHGSAGIAQIYRKISVFDKSSYILDAANQWTNLTKIHVKSYLESKSLLGLHGQKEEEFGLLYGYSGIALHLISNFSSNQTWDGCLMLD